MTDAIIMLVCAGLASFVVYRNLSERQPQAEVIPFKAPTTTVAPMSSYDINAKRKAEEAKRDIESGKLQDQLMTLSSRLDSTYKQIENLESVLGLQRLEIEKLEKQNKEFTNTLGMMNRNINQLHSKPQTMTVKIDGPVEFTKALPPVPVKQDQPVPAVPEQLKKKNGVKNRALFSESEK